MNALYFCAKENRRAGVLAHATLNGIDFLEVLDDQRLLAVHFLKPLGATVPAQEKLRIAGGERIRKVAVVSAAADPADERVLNVRVDRAGDFSIYTLSVFDLPQAFDALLSSVDFSFKIECPSDFDCQARRSCPPSTKEQPELDYLAKDYASFRQLMLDRMSARMPQWTERNAADLGVTLVELLAYVGDQLSYQQDAVATEAYLGTARKRVSARRHARLVDYFMHDGCNARAWVQVRATADTFLPGATMLLTADSAQSGRLAPHSGDWEKALQTDPVIFETMFDVALFAAHDELKFYTWGDERCCLPRGATRAWLSGHFPDLQSGDVLIFEETLGPRTGDAADADPAHRQAVRLKTAPVQTTDPLSDQPITGIEWSDEDALTFPLCVSAVTDADHDEKFLPTVSVALGNIVLADHGRTLPGAEKLDLGSRLRNAPLTMAAPLKSGASAAAALRWEMRDVLPAITLNDGSWQPRFDLLDADESTQSFVAETDENGAATLRFGDGQHGRRPQKDDTFSAKYRVGSGTRGNVGAAALRQIVSADAAISGVRNPLPASGGVEAETIEHVRQHAPFAFRTQERAVTAEDYAEVAMRFPGVQKAAAVFRWTGSWRTVFVAVDRLGGAEVDAAFAAAMRAHLERYRMAGHDLEIEAPRYVSLEIVLTICVKPDYFRGDVKAALLQVFSNRLRPDGSRGLFHPDNFSFGQPVYLSPLYAAALQVEGVGMVRVTKFQRQVAPDLQHLALDGSKIDIARMEIARLENDPNFPERGVLTLNMEDGQ